MTTFDAPTARTDIYIAGDPTVARQVCREFCFRVGLCVTLEPVDYIYTGGEERGVKVGLINYPRFPSNEADIVAKAEELGVLLMDRLCQHSFSVVGPSVTRWFTRRPNTEGVQ